MERIFALDKNTAPVFAALHPESPEQWYREDTVALGVIRENEAAALFLATVTEETIWLDWLYVKEEYRREGIGTRLLNTFSDHSGGCSKDARLHTACREELKEYLHARGFDFPEEPACSAYTAPLSTVQGLPPVKESDKIRPIYTLSGSELNRLNDLFFDASQQSVGIALPIDPIEYLKESAVYMDDEIRAALFLKQIGDSISISHVYAASVNEGGKLLQLLSNAKESITDRFWPEIVVSAAALNERSETLIKKLLPEAEREDVWEGSMVLI